MAFICEIGFSGPLFSSVFQWRVVKKLLDEVDVAQKHPAAAIALHAKSVQSVAGKNMHTKHTVC